MNLEHFIGLHNHIAFDEIHIIGKDLEREGKPYHIVGLLRKGTKAELLVLGLCEDLEERKFNRESNRREQMRHSILSEERESFFMRIRSFICEDVTYETGGATTGCCGCGDYGETYVLLEKLLQAGWCVAEDSPFYKAQWEFLEITRVELREEMECLPEWKGLLEVEFDTKPQRGVLEIPVELKTGEEKEIHFKLQDGREATCYINRVYLPDVWEEEKSKFEDSAYRERMLQHVSEEQLEQIKEQLFGVLADICPQGMCFPVIEYECTEEINLQFYDKVYLDTTEEPKRGSATALIMRAKPQTEVGCHGLKMRACIIQSPMEPEAENIVAEIFSYTELIQKKYETIDI